MGFLDGDELKKRVSILMMVFAASLTLPSIPRHVIPPYTLADKAEVLLAASSPRAPLPNRQYSDKTAKMVQYRYDKACSIT